ncbi:uncharacterized protein A4U43_UnF750 [Asparagus officinalis]|uniref:Uncharacterized protein n=1 Tax=Asparagus officinalis TaxID=4686 RepID=A0A1R3L7Q5_ASPOF|nr:uncharacterized protein A4U43_UnF750 [Asparagus officinalis]
MDLDLCEEWIHKIMSTNSSSKRCTRRSSRVSPAEVVPGTAAQSSRPPWPSASPPAMIPAIGAAAAAR